MPSPLFCARAAGAAKANRAIDVAREVAKRRIVADRIQDGGRVDSRRRLILPLVAVVIASDLSKDMVGNPLFESVSFKLERRDRMTIAGRNGAGKTTLLRMLAGETSVDSGKLTFGKGVRVALHDQRPPRERGLALREYALSGCKEQLALETELETLEHAMADGD